MSEMISVLKHINTNNHLDVADLSPSTSTSPCSLSSFSMWKINYKQTPRKSESKGVWDGYQTKDEFMTMHLR